MEILVFGKRGSTFRPCGRCRKNMPLGEAVLLLRKSVMRKVGFDARVNFVDVDGPLGRRLTPELKRPLPIVTIDGEIAAAGAFSFKDIVEKALQKRENPESTHPILRK